MTSRITRRSQGQVAVLVATVAGAGELRTEFEGHSGSGGPLRRSTRHHLKPDFAAGDIEESDAGKRAKRKSHLDETPKRRKRRRTQDTDTDMDSVSGVSNKENLDPRHVPSHSTPTSETRKHTSTRVFRDRLSKTAMVLEDARQEVSSRWQDEELDYESKYDEKQQQGDVLSEIEQLADVSRPGDLRHFEREPMSEEDLDLDPDKIPDDRLWEVTLCDKLLKKKEKEKEQHSTRHEHKKTKSTPSKAVETPPPRKQRQKEREELKHIRDIMADKRKYFEELDKDQIDEVFIVQEVD